MRRLTILSAAFLLAAISLEAKAAQLKVVTTTSDLASIARAVAGDRAKVASVCDGTEDPHTIQARPSYILLARDADLWIRVGLELEIGWEGPIIDGSRNPRIRPGSAGHLDASQGAMILEVPSERVTRAMGDVHPSGNPHYWLDPWNGRIAARNIRDRLAELDPSVSPVYADNCAAFVARIDSAMFGAELVSAVGAEELWRLELAGALDQALAQKDLRERVGGWVATMRPYRGSKIITYHRSWSYLANRFGLVVAAELEPKPGIPPGPQHLAQVVDQAKQSGVRLILKEPFYSDKGPAFVASKADLKIVEAAISVGGQPQASDYVSLIDNAVARIAQALGEGGQ